MEEKGKIVVIRVWLGFVIVYIVRSDCKFGGFIEKNLVG